MASYRAAVNKLAYINARVWLSRCMLLHRRNARAIQQRSSGEPYFQNGKLFRGMLFAIALLYNAFSA